MVIGRLCFPGSTATLARGTRAQRRSSPLSSLAPLLRLRSGISVSLRYLSAIGGSSANVAHTCADTSSDYPCFCANPIMISAPARARGDAEQVGPRGPLSLDQPQPAKRGCDVNPAVCRICTAGEGGIDPRQREGESAKADDAEQTDRGGLPAAKPDPESKAAGDLQEERR